MLKRRGYIIHSSLDACGVLEIIDDGLVRSLYFGSHARQSAMLLAQPVVLVLPYTQAMLAHLLFQCQPQRVLLIGLGGGSLAKFFLHYFPKCHIDAVECRAQVVKLAHDYFNLPEDPRLKVYIADGSEYILAPPKPHPPYDMIMVDAYDHRGLVPTCASEDFFKACRQQLTADGTLVINLWHSEPQHYRHTLRNLKNCFEQQVLKLPVPGHTNTIAFASAQGWPKLTDRRWLVAAEELEQRTGLDFSTLLKRLQHHNSPYWSRLRG